MTHPYCSMRCIVLLHVWTTIHCVCVYYVPYIHFLMYGHYIAFISNYCEQCCYAYRYTEIYLCCCFQILWLFTQKQKCWVVPWLVFCGIITTLFHSRYTMFSSQQEYTNVPISQCPCCHFIFGVRGSRTSVLKWGLCVAQDGLPPRVLLSLLRAGITGVCHYTGQVFKTLTTLLGIYTQFLNNNSACFYHLSFPGIMFSKLNTF